MRVREREKDLEILGNNWIEIARTLDVRIRVATAVARTVAARPGHIRARGLSKKRTSVSFFVHVTRHPRLY